MMHENREDEERDALELELLAIRCQLGEGEAFDELVERFHAPLWRYVAGLTRDAAVAEEILQDAWLRILRGVAALRRPSRLRSWIFSITRRAFMDRLRSRYAEREVEELPEEPAGGEAPIELDVVEDAELLRGAIDELSPADRETTLLFYLRELDLREVAEVLDVPVGTVKSRLHRARRQLRLHLEAKGVHR